MNENGLEPNKGPTAPPFETPGDEINRSKDGNTTLQTPPPQTGSLAPVASSDQNAGLSQNAGLDQNAGSDQNAGGENIRRYEIPDKENQKPPREYRLTSTRFASYTMPTQGFGFPGPSPNQVQNSSYSFTGGFPTPYGVRPLNGTDQYYQQQYPYYQQQFPIPGRYPFQAGGFTVLFSGPSPNGSGQYYQHQVPTISAPGFGVGYPVQGNQFSNTFPYQQPLKPEFPPYGGFEPQQPMLMGYNTRDPIASMLALQQSMMMTQFQESLMSSRTAVKAIESNTEENLDKGSKKQQKIEIRNDYTTSKKEPAGKKREVNVKKLNKDVHEMFKKVLIKNRVIKKYSNDGQGGRGGKGGRGSGYKRDGYGGGRGRGGNGGQGLAV